MAGDQCFFSIPLESLHSIFELQRPGAIPQAFGEFQVQRASTAKIFGTASARLMLPDAALDVDGNTGVKRTVGTADNIQAVLACGHRSQARAPVIVSPSTRNAPASILSPFSGVSAQVSTISETPPSSAAGL